MFPHALCAIFWVAGATLAADREPMLPTTTPPIVYTMDYRGPFFSDPTYLDRFKAAPPDLLHVGKALPITHLWGPVRLYRGENQYTGGPGNTLNCENIALLTPDAVRQRVENIRDTLARYHALGIREIVPYISYHALTGDHQKRLGFWNFYDHWTEFEKWAGPRPEHDPFEWLAVDQKGRFLPGTCGGYTPDYYAPLHRYRACITNPDWAQWHRRLVWMAADVGYDGCFVAKTHPDPCYCQYCKDHFRQWLAANHDTDWVGRLTKELTVDRLTLDSKQTPAELVRRWRLLRTAEHLGMLRQTARKAKPGFTIFPNSGNIRECLTMGSQCDRLMFESTSSPGLLSAGMPPADETVGVRVVAGAADSRRHSHICLVSDPLDHAALKAEISVPTETQVGKPADFKVRVASVGEGPADNDFAEEFALLLCKAPGGTETRLDLQPTGPIGGTGSPRKAKQPPLVLRTAWTPKREGTYSVEFAFRYTDEGHGPQAVRHLHRIPLTTSRLCVDHVAELLFTQHMHARTMFLDYEAARKGWENVQELALAELAAFSGGGGISASGHAQATYRAFFKSHPELFAGWTPTAPAAVLYAYWGPNPLDPAQPIGQSTIGNCLAAGHRPFVALIDASLPQQSEELTRFAAIYLDSPAYEMTADSLQALRDYCGHGHLVLANKQVTINGRPAIELLGGGRVAIWDPKRPMLPTAAIASAEGIRRNVRFAVYQQADRLVVHAVNYNVCLLDPQKKVLEVEATPLQVPLPSGWKAARVTCFDPGAGPETLPCTVTEGVAHVTLPKLHIYKIVLLERG
jgi:hypothetical protein